MEWVRGRARFHAWGIEMATVNRGAFWVSFAAPSSRAPRLFPTTVVSWGAMRPTILVPLSARTPPLGRLREGCVGPHELLSGGDQLEGKVGLMRGHRFCCFG